MTAETSRANDEEGGACQVTKEVNFCDWLLMRSGDGTSIDLRKPLVDDTNGFAPDECNVGFVEGGFSDITVAFPLGSFEANHIRAVDTQTFVLRISVIECRGITILAKRRGISQLPRLW